MRVNNKTKAPSTLQEHSLSTLAKMAINIPPQQTLYGLQYYVSYNDSVVEI